MWRTLFHLGALIINEHDGYEKREMAQRREKKTELGGRSNWMEKTANQVEIMSTCAYKPAILHYT